MNGRRGEGDLAYLLHMRDAAHDARSHLSGISLRVFLEDKKTQDAIIRKLEVLGEAAKRISPELKRKNVAVPWKMVTGMRDRLIHDYGDVDLLVVWETVKRDIPKLIQQLNTLLKKLKNFA